MALRKMKNSNLEVKIKSTRFCELCFCVIGTAYRFSNFNIALFCFERSRAFLVITRKKTSSSALSNYFMAIDLVERVIENYGNFITQSSAAASCTKCDLALKESYGFLWSDAYCLSL